MVQLFFARTRLELLTRRLCSQTQFCVRTQTTGRHAHSSSPPSSTITHTVCLLQRPTRVQTNKPVLWPLHLCPLWRNRRSTPGVPFHRELQSLRWCFTSAITTWMCWTHGALNDVRRQCLPCHPISTWTANSHAALNKREPFCGSALSPPSPDFGTQDCNPPIQPLSELFQCF